MTSIKNFLIKNYIRHVNKRLIISTFDIKIYVRTAKNLTNRLIKIIRSFEPFSKKIICVDIKNPAVSSGVVNVSAEKFLKLRKNNFKNIPKKYLWRWDICVNNLTHSAIDKIHPNILFTKKKQIMITIGKMDYHGFCNFSIAFDRMAFWDTEMIQKFCSHLIDITKTFYAKQNLINFVSL